MGDFALHFLAWCLINHMCDFSYCNNSLEGGGVMQQNKNRT